MSAETHTQQSRVEAQADTVTSGRGLDVETSGKLSSHKLIQHVINAVRLAEEEGYFDRGWLDKKATYRSVWLLIQGLQRDMYRGSEEAMNTAHLTQHFADQTAEAAIHIPHLFGIPIDGLKHKGWGVVRHVGRPNIRKLVPPDTGSLAEGKTRAKMAREERYPDKQGILEIINAHTQSDRTRLVPFQPGFAISAEAGTCIDGYQAMDGMPLMYSVTRKHAERVSYVLECARRANEDTVICIPTCPCDPIEVEEGDYGVKFSRGALIEDGVSWTALNTVDAPAVILPDLVAKLPEEQNIRLVFTLGDFEFGSGSNRGMSEVDFFKAMDRNANVLRAYVAERLSSSVASGRVQIDVRGIMSLVGGREGWDRLRAEIARKVDNFFAEASPGDLEKLLSVRRVIYQSLREDGAVTDEEVLAALKGDVLDYCVGDQAFREAFDSNGRRSIVLAGDSRSMHQIAAYVTGSVLLSVNGGYQGSL